MRASAAPVRTGAIVRLDELALEHPSSSGEELCARPAVLDGTSCARTKTPLQALERKRK